MSFEDFRDKRDFAHRLENFSLGSELHMRITRIEADYLQRLEGHRGEAVFLDYPVGFKTAVC